MAESQRLSERQLRRITQKLMGGIEISPEEAAAQASHEAWKRDVGEPTARTLVTEATGVPGALRSYRDAAADPSLANVTDAGVRTALMAFKPALALKLLGAGYGAAAAKDSGLPGALLPVANAQKRGQAEPTPTLPGLTPEQNAELAAARKKAASGFATGTERRTTEETINRLQGLSADYVRGQNEADIAKRRASEESAQRDYDTAVNRADFMRSSILAKDKSFKDSDVGKIYEKTGGFTPLLAGVAGGAVSRLAHGGGNAVKSFALPAAEGAGLTYATLNAPLLYDAYNTPAKNPEKEAAEAYARELPQTHPRKSEFADYAKSFLSDLNPVRESARADLFSPGGQARRLLTGAVEGVPAGILGANLVPAARRGIEGIGEVPGALLTGVHKGMGKASRARSASAEADLVASEAEAAAAEVARRKGAQTGGPSSAQPGTIADPPPSPVPPGNQSSPLPVPVSNAPSLQQGAPGVITLAPELSETLKGIADKLAGAGRPSIAGVRTPGSGRWAEEIAPTARDVLKERAAAGQPLGPKKAAEIGRMIEAKLPEGVSAPSAADVRTRVANQIEALGNTPTAAQLDVMFAKSPGSLFKGRKVFGVAPAIGATGYALSPDDAAASPAVTTSDIARMLMR